MPSTIRNARLIRLMQWSALLSTYEAIACLRDYRLGIEYSSEAVNHYGGTTAVVKRALQLRTNYQVRDMLRPNS